MDPVTANQIAGPTFPEGMLGGWLAACTRQEEQLDKSISKTHLVPSNKKDPGFPITHNDKKHTLYLVTYDRGAHPLTGLPRPRHWAFFLETNSAGSTAVNTASDPDTSDSQGVIFQLRGMPGGFYYPGPEHNLGRAQRGEPGILRDTVEIGEVDDSAATKVEGVVGVQGMHQVLAGLEVVKDESARWNCQDWALAGLARLKEAGGVVYDGVTADGLKAWLREE